MKLNWRDASKELPKLPAECVVLSGDVDKYSDCFDLDKKEWMFSSKYNLTVRLWIYIHELPIPGE